MNHLADMQILHNHYFVLRHGTSQANEQQIILSDPKEGTTNYGLSDSGKVQVKISAEKALQGKILDSTTIIYSSDFTRAKETAEIAREVLHADPIIITPLLRERFFGKLEKTHNSNYQKVWDDDVKNPHHTNHDVESTSAVLNRTTMLILEIEEKFVDKNILLVSHGDALQILQTGFEKVSSAHHRQLSHLQTAEIRELHLI